MAGPTAVHCLSGDTYHLREGAACFKRCLVDNAQHILESWGIHLSLKVCISSLPSLSWKRTASMQVNWMQAPQPLSAAVLRMGMLPFTDAMAPSG